MKQSVTVGAHLLWGGHYGCNNGRYGCTIVMSYIEINKAVSQWLLTFNLCVSVTWSLTCAFHIPCTRTPEIIDMHRGVCDKNPAVLAPSSDATRWCKHCRSPSGILPKSQGTGPFCKTRHAHSWPSWQNQIYQSGLGVRNSINFSDTLQDAVGFSKW